MSTIIGEIKSYFYERLDDGEKKRFIEKWKCLESDSEKANESIQSLFRYHMFYLRAKEGDEKTTTPGVGKFFLEEGKKRLTPQVIDELADNLHLWEVVNRRQELEDEPWSRNMDIRKTLDCLSSYPNEFWKYPVSIFYMQYKGREDFEELFLKFLRKLCVMLLTRFLDHPTVSSVKGDILKLDVQIINTFHPVFHAGFDERRFEDEQIIRPHTKIVRMLLKLIAYQEEEQRGLLPESWGIEHIFPRKWDTRYYALSEEEVDKLEHLGNKLPLEKALRIFAGKNYFDKKKTAYLASAIAVCRKLGESSIDDWDMDSIDGNDVRVCSLVKGIFDQWIKE